MPKKKAPPRPKKKVAKRKTAKKSATRAAKKKVAKRTSSKKTTSSAPAKGAARKTTKKKATKRKVAKKTSSAKKKAAKKTSSRKKTGACSSRSCTARKRAGGSLIERAKDCQNLEECRRFIAELGDAAEQANQWLDEMHSQALSAEQTRDLYAEQISDLLEAVDADRARIKSLESEVKKARRGASRSSASDAVLRKLGELSREIQAIRSDLEQLGNGLEPARSKGHGRARPRTAKTTRTAEPRTTRSARRAEDRAGGFPQSGQFAKHSVLRGAACSLGVGKHGYPPEVCAPASFPRDVAAQILGNYAQNDYSGLAKWAFITGLPIDDGARPVVVASPPSPAMEAASPRRSKARAKTKPKAKPTTRRKKKTTSKSSRKAPSSPAKAISPKDAQVSTGDPTSQQILDQMLLTIARF